MGCVLSRSTGTPSQNRFFADTWRIAATRIAINLDFLVTRRSIAFPPLILSYFLPHVASINTSHNRLESIDTASNLFILSLFLYHIITVLLFFILFRVHWIIFLAIASNFSSLLILILIYRNYNFTLFYVINYNVFIFIMEFKKISQRNFRSRNECFSIWLFGSKYFSFY